MVYAPANFEVSTFNDLGGDVFSRKIHCLTLGEATRDVAEWPLHHVTYAPAKFEVAMCNGQGVHLQENTLFDL